MRPVAASVVLPVMFCAATPEASVAASAVKTENFMLELRMSFGCEVKEGKESRGVSKWVLDSLGTRGP